MYGVSNPIAYVDPNGTFVFLSSTLGKIAVGAVINVVTTCIAAAVTGQEVTWKDIGVAALSGAIGASTLNHANAIAGAIAGVHTAIATYQSGASLGGALAAGAVSGIITAGSMSATGEKLLGKKLDTVVTIAVNSVFDTAGNSISAVASKSATVISPRKGNPSNSTATSNVQPKKPNTAPAAPSRAGGSAQKMLMVMY